MRRNWILLLGTRRGILSVIRNSLVAFGLFSGVLQFVLALWTSLRIGDHGRWAVLLIMICGSLVFGILKSWPQHEVRRNFRHLDIKITVRVGDIFDQHTHMVIGVTDVFDTDTAENVVINSASMQGQFLNRIYGDRQAQLDQDISAALSGVSVEFAEPATAKPLGKRNRYPIGTVAVLGTPERRYFLAAYSRMQNNLISVSNLDCIWHSLGSVWEAVYVYGQRKAVAIPVIGSDLARGVHINHENLVKLIVLSFVERSRRGILCKELVVVVHPKDLQDINMLEVEAFIRRL